MSQDKVPDFTRMEQDWLIVKAGLSGEVRRASQDWEAPFWKGAGDPIPPGTTALHAFADPAIREPLRRALKDEHQAGGDLSSGLAHVRTLVDQRNRLLSFHRSEQSLLNKQQHRQKALEREQQQQDIETLQHLELLRNEKVNELLLAARSFLRSAFPDNAASCRQRAPSLTEDDCRLADRWARDRGNSNYYITAMRSARQAERAALLIYDALYGSTVDLSMKQLTNPSDHRWKLADIGIGRRMYDVKNSRNSFGRTARDPISYSEHCVAELKRTRDQTDVIITAWLSEFSKALNETCTHPEGQPHILWLGETTRSRLHTLRGFFEDERLRLLFDRGLEGPALFLPPWVFEFPSVIYAKRSASLLAFRSKPQEQIPWPLQMLLDFDAPGEIRRASSLYNEWDLLKKLVKNPITISRPTLFLHVLRRFVDSMAIRHSFPGRELRQLIFFDGHDNAERPFSLDSWTPLPSSFRAAPLGLFDPLRTISALIETLETVDRYCRAAAVQFESFRMPKLNILQGCNVSEPWKTIIAYCGGENIRYKVRCGAYPLLMGANETCEECNRLICREPDCQYCSMDCRTGEARRRKIELSLANR